MEKTISVSGGSSGAPTEQTKAAGGGAALVTPSTNVAMAYVMLPGGVDGAEATVVNLSSYGLRLYPWGTAVLAKDGGATASYVETTDVGATARFRYVALDDYWVLLSSTGTWTWP